MMLRFVIGRVLALILMVLVCLGAFSFSRAEAAPAVVWSVLQVSSPTNFTGGSEATGGASNYSSPRYGIFVENIGGQASTEITVTDELPAGLETAALSPEWRYKAELHQCGFTAQTVTCVINEPIAADDDVEVVIPLKVSSAAPPTVENRVSVFEAGTDVRDSLKQTDISSAVPPFDLLPSSEGISGSAVDEAGEPAVAGSHPFAVTLEGAFPSKHTPQVPVGQDITGVETLRDLNFQLPKGLVVNPQATPILCKEADLVRQRCPAQSQVGVLLVETPFLFGAARGHSPLFNMEPPPGLPAEFGINILGVLVHIDGGLDGEFNLTAKSRDILAKVPVTAVRARLWGDPSDTRHDTQRYGEGCPTGCSVPPLKTAFLTMPSACSESMSLGVGALSWEGGSAEGRGSFLTPQDTSETVTGCSNLAFAPSASVSPDSRSAESPTGLSLAIHIPQNEGVNGLATATLKRVSLRLPPGVAVATAAANGLDACAPSQVGLGSEGAAACPNSSKIGTAEISTPLLGKPLKGSIYLATPRVNPFGTLLGLYLVVEGEGIVIKLAGRVDADSSTGQLTATFDENPQLPFSELTVHLNGGPRAPLTTPGCGVSSVRTELTSWARPEKPVVIDSPFTVDQGCGGGFSPMLSAGTKNPVAGASSPFILRVTRADGEQNLSRIVATLPKGVLAKLAGVVVCPDAEANSGSCPAASQVGSATVGTGDGPQPLYIPQPGKAPTAIFLAGPYQGAPLSLVVKVPAQAGPFDLGDVVVRTAIHINPVSTQITAVSSPLPQILEGIPIAYRDVRIEINRPSFMVNPTSCAPMQVDSLLSSSGGATATPSDRFQVAGCQSLGFGPKLALSLTGAPTRRGGHPRLRAVVTAKSGEANIARAAVILPKTEFLENAHIKTVCTRVQYSADDCPKNSIYGYAKAWTPLLAKPLAGPVYLRSSSHTLPDLVASLDGQIHIDLDGRIDSVHSRVRNTFEAVPDAPITKFELRMRGGPRGLLVNNTGLCKAMPRATARLTGHNGKVVQTRPRVNVGGCAKQGKAQRK